METLLIILHVFVSVVLIVAVLLQSGKGGGMGATFGGASQQIFGGRGAATFLAKITTVAAVTFFITSLSLSMISSRERSALEDRLGKKSTPAPTDAAPAAPAPEAGAQEEQAEPAGDTQAQPAAQPAGDTQAQPAAQPAGGTQAQPAAQPAGGTQAPGTPTAAEPAKDQ